MLRLFLLVSLLGTTAQAAERVFDFTTNALQQPPPGFRSTVTGLGRPGDWRIIFDEVPSTLPALSPKALTNKRPVLAQLSQDPTDEHFPLLVLEEEMFGDFRLTVRVKTVSGEVEQMAGIAFRIQDETNYYVLRISSRGNSFRFYKFVNGQRSPPIGPEILIPSNVWHEVSIDCKGNQIRCALNGKEAIPTLTDNSFAAGKIGLWTKSDSVSYFSDLKIAYVPREKFAQVLVRETLQRYPRLLGLKLFAIPPNETNPRVIASHDGKQIGELGEKTEKDCLLKGGAYYGKTREAVIVTMPLHDRNGEKIAAAQLRMKTFRGQTEHNALARALPIIKQMEARLAGPTDLLD